MNGYCKARKCNEAMEFFFLSFLCQKLREWVFLLMMKREKREIGFNFRVGLIFNSVGFILIKVRLILNGYVMSYHTCN
jgi:hypothetical protein